MRAWLQSRMNEVRDYFPEVEPYVLGRGVPEVVAHRLGMGMWPDEDPATEAPNADFCDRYGTLGERLSGKLTTPIYSPRGDLMGFEARSMEEKKLTRFLLPHAEWNPVFLGLDQTTTRAIHEGANVWIGEGIFDLGALCHAVPTGDVVLASMWARLSRKHVEFLRRWSRGLISMVYDEDETGRKGVLGAIDPDTKKRRWGALESLRFVGLECRDVRYRGGKDVGEIWERSGTTGLKEALNNYL